MIHHRNDEDVRELFNLGFHKRPAEELYDLRSDPDQMKNLADNPEYDEVKDRLRTRLMNMLRSTGDPRVIDEGDAFDYPPFCRPGLTVTEESSENK